MWKPLPQRRPTVPCCGKVFKTVEIGITTTELPDVRCEDLQLSDDAIDALARLLVDAALQDVKDDAEVTA